MGGLSVESLILAWATGSSTEVPSFELVSMSSAGRERLDTGQIATTRGLDDVHRMLPTLGAFH
jgi:hypothetical protein